MVLEVEPTFTVGVTGKRGSGKTSVMRRAFATLGGRPIEQPLMLAKDSGLEVGSEGWETWLYSDPNRPKALAWEPWVREAAEGSLCVWYSPWQHQNEPNPLVPLIGEIRAQFTAWLKLKQTLSGFNRRAGLAVGTLLERMVDVALSLKLGQPGQVVSGTLGEMRKAWRAGADDDGLTAASDGQRFHLLFEDAVTELLKARAGGADLNDGARLVIFVDDLDRCDGNVAVRLLEIVKLYLGTRRCVFVLGLDDSAVLDVLRTHRSPSEESNREYLEKLFQATVSVPLPAQPQVRDAVAGQMRLHGIPRGLSGDPQVQAETDDARELLAEDIERLLEPNPRKIKNFVNSLCAAWAMHDCSDWIATSENYYAEATRFVLIQYLKQFHRPVWRLVERQPDAIEILRSELTGEHVGTEPKRRPDERGLLGEIFFRAFCHVLEGGKRSDDPTAPLRHGRQTLDEAVTAALERRDRNRSDTTFRQLFLALFDGDHSLNLRHIYLAVPDEAPPPIPDSTADDLAT